MKQSPRDVTKKEKLSVGSKRWWALWRDRAFLLAFGLLFALSGVRIFVSAAWQPMLVRIESASWPAVDAEVIYSSVSTASSSDDSLMYEFKLRYRYQYQGDVFYSSRYKPIKFSSADRSKIQQLQTKYPKGAAIKAYVNPQRPTYAIVNRNFEAVDWLGWSSLIFVGVGVAALVYLFRIKNPLKWNES